ncbi:hypothetical protein LUZ60_003623 [Juncus effusus]|nr:hypothetical protein LUZ60_003623 [Juncus effusus]
MEGQGHAQNLIESYEAAMDALSSIIGQNKLVKSGVNIGGKFELMFNYLEMLGLDESMSRLKIIHVAGTKGKGSTCTFCESILRECGLRTGLFTSPHLIDVRERFRINGLEMPMDKFLDYFWDIWNQLKSKTSDEFPMPRLFQFLTLLAFKIFFCEKVDVAIIEVGIGGKLDTTNVIKEPVVCGISSLGMDHMEILGNTIEQIASEKAGIFKHNCPAFTVPQVPQATSVLQDIASQLMIPLEVSSPLDEEKLKGLKLGLDGDHQFINASLAVSLSKCFLQRTDLSHLSLSDSKEEEFLPKAFLRGLTNTSLLGRAQIIKDNNFEKLKGNLVFFLDGAHTPESLEVCAKWFSVAIPGDENNIMNYGEILNEFHEKNNENINQSERTSKRILLFNCMDKRDPQLLLPELINTCSTNGVYFSKAVFAPTLSISNKVVSAAYVAPSEPAIDLTWQSTLQRTWEKLVHNKEGANGKLANYNCNGLIEETETQFDKWDSCASCFCCSSVIPSLPLALMWLRECASKNPTIQYQVLVTGSLHLVGDVLKLLKT